MVDVARQAGVSLKTVSRVINNEAGVHEGTAARVHDAVSRLGFRRNEVARNLRRGQSTASIGVLVEDIAHAACSALTWAVEQAAREHGHLVLVGSSDQDPTRERELFSAFVSRRVDGLIIVPAGDDHRYVAREMLLGTAAVFVDRPSGRISADAVLSDNAGGARQAVEHLVRQGHRRIAVVGDRPGLYPVRERVNGYRAALTAAGIAVQPRLIRVEEAREGFTDEVAEELLTGTEPATAVITLNNRITVAMLRTIRKLQRRVALVGFDDFESSDLIEPAVTVVAQDPMAMGRTAASLLFARLAAESRTVERIVLPTRLIARGSGEIPPEPPER